MLRELGGLDHYLFASVSVMYSLVLLYMSCVNTDKTYQNGFM